MKMNNLSNPSRVILSNLARVILSKAKNPVLAASLVAFAACSDYLEDFQDKYDDGKAFAEISSDDDGKSSSSNGGDSKLSSSSKTGEGISSDKGSSSSNDDSELSSSSDDSKLSSSSKGNGDVDSSDSSDSSSSAANPGSSSSVAESSSSAFESCTGTVIYDASDSEPTKTRFGTYFKYYGNPQRGVVDIDKDTKSAPVSINDHPGFLFSESYTIKDISSWEGLCIEYTSSTPLGIFLLSHNGNDVNSAAYRELPTNSGEPVLVSWNDMFQVFDDLSGYRAFSFDHVDQIYFGYEKNAVLANVSRITTIAKDVDLNAGASSEEPSTGYILPTNKCPGTEIYNEDKGSIFEFPVKSWNEGNTTTTLTDMSLIGSTGDDGVYFFIADYPSGTPISIKQWGGLCLEYTSTNNMYVEIANVQNSQTSSLASSTLPAQETKIAYAIPLKAFYDVYVDGDIYFVNERFDPAKVNRISFTNIDGGTTQASISRITTLYPGVTFE